MLSKGRVEGLLADRGDLLDFTSKHLGRSKERDALVMVLLIVPFEKLLKPGACSIDVEKATGIVRLILCGAEVGLGEGVVVRDARATHALIYAKVSQQVREGMARHRSTTVVMDRELFRSDAVARDGFLEKLFGKRRVLVRSDHPTDDITTE